MDNEAPKSQIILYQTEDGQTRIQCRLENETIWLTQALIAELFQVHPAESGHRRYSKIRQRLEIQTSLM